MKRNKKSAGIIYSVENEITGEYYIGATTSSLEDRKQDHMQKANNDSGSYFHEAISTYGTEAFIWNEIDSANSINELAKKEKDYIVSYNSKDEGYNCDSGGGFKKTIYQYYIEDRTLINSYDSLESAASAINATKQDISRACLSVNKIYKEFYWSYEYIEPFESLKDKRRKQVLMFSLEGKLIDKFKSVADASRKTGISKTCISRVCRGERKYSKGYIWKYK